MTEDDYVVCLRDVDLYGVGKILEVLDYDQLAVEFDGRVDQFSAHELELASVFYGGRRDVAA